MVSVRFILIVVAVCVFCMGCVGTSSPSPLPTPYQPPEFRDVPQTGMLWGNVTCGGAPISGANVSVYTPTGEWSMVTSAGDGSFSAPLTENGTYMVRASASGYAARPEFCEYNVVDGDLSVEIDMRKVI